MPLSYETAFALRELPQGTYIFADLERLSGADLGRAAWLWQQLAVRGDRMQLLNHPTQVKQRFELLRTLHTQGLNDFDVYRLDEYRVPKRFPVFVRNERQHNAVASGLIPDAPALEEFLQRWRAGGQSVGDNIITEFCGEPDDHGLYRRYGIFKVGEHIIPANVFFEYTWEVRGLPHTSVINEHTIAVETAFLRDNPHEAQLRKVFSTAQIDYGRIDYALVNGRIQVYEINTNPYIAPNPLGGKRRAAIYEQFSRNFLEALQALNGRGTALCPVQPASVPHGRQAKQRQWVKQTLYSSLWQSGPSAIYAQRLRHIRRLVVQGRLLWRRPVKKS
ncbi:hypothetical protein ACFFLM_00330 [Deinococcus oregonensis]|uniref:ATP-grasp domain-containing protein n=1 Tax=Deinococcus oregonensis TaxID=1805970 RepID=A0ABV6ASG2_9DEIO